MENDLEGGLHGQKLVQHLANGVLSFDRAALVCREDDDGLRFVEGEHALDIAGVHRLLPRRHHLLRTSRVHDILLSLRHGCAKRPSVSRPVAQRQILCQPQRWGSSRSMPRENLPTISWTSISLAGWMRPRRQSRNRRSSRLRAKMPAPPERSRARSTTLKAWLTAKCLAETIFTGQFMPWSIPSDQSCATRS